MRTFWIVGVCIVGKTAGWGRRGKEAGRYGVAVKSESL